MAMICSSENRFRFISRLLSKGRILAPSGLNRGVTSGCFAVLNTGHKAIASKNRLLITGSTV
jgi:hypothetical protein